MVKDIEFQSRIKMPQISVILTSFNHGRFIREAIESVLNQTFQNLELIIWDDASVDDSWEIIQSYNDSRIRAYRNPENKGPVFGVNKAIFEIAQGEYIAIHHSDDAWETDKLQKQVDFLEANQGIGAVFTNAQIIDERGAPLADATHFYYNIFSQPNRSSHEWLRFFFLSGNALCHPSILIRRQCYEDCGPYLDMLAQIPDFDMWVRLCSKYEIHVLDGRLVKFRILDGEMNASGNRPLVRIRSANENYKLLQRYRSIAGKDRIFKIFPDFISYDRQGDTDAEYILAKVCLESAPYFQMQLLAIDILFDILNNPLRRKIVERVYGFSSGDFITITGQCDLFSREEILRLQAAVTERDGQIADLTQAVTERDGQIANLTQTNSWRLTRPLREIRRWLSRPVEQGRIYRAVYMRFPLIRNLRTRYLQFNQRLRQSIYSISHSAQNTPALQNLSEARVLLTTTISQPADNGESPAVPITISVVTFNSGRWIKSFMYSLMSQTYPLELINLRFMDHGSTDDTVTQLVDVTINYKNRFSSIEYAQQSNLGFGAGHDSILRAANTEFCLVTNIDIEFERDAIKVVVKAALADQTCSIASWELRQIPYEHPKFYDPVTQLTNWSSHACILLLRDAYLKVGGYDRAIFMYCEDVELSYRFRSYGYGLRYVPQAVVIHHTYEEAGQVKPLQFYGGALGNYYLRLRYGNFQDRLAGAANYVGKLIHPNGVPGARRTLLSNLGNLLYKTPHFLRGRGPRMAYFPFRGNDYELTREGAFIDIAYLRQGICDAQVRPLVSVITRTVQGREILLEQAARSVFNQTYANIEFIVSQDGGEPTNAIIKKLQNLAPSSMRLVFLGNAKQGRSAAGNAALKIAQGNYLIFLDDDDLFFPDHVEVLLGSILKDNSLEGAYSLALEVQTDMAPNYQNYTEHIWDTPSVFWQPWDYEVLKNHNFMPIQAVLFSRMLYEKWGGFNEELDQLEDWNLWLRFGYKARFAFIPKTTSIYRTPHDLKVRLARNELLHAAYEAARLDAINTTTLYSQRAELALTVYDQKHSTPPTAVKAL